MDWREMLARIRQAVVGAEALNARIDAHLGAVMQDGHPREVTHFPPGVADPLTQVRLFGIHEEALIHEAGALDCFTASQHEGAGRPVARDLTVVGLQIELALAEPRRASGKALRRKRVAERSKGVGEVTDRQVQPSIVEDLTDTDQADLRPLIHTGDEIAERAVEDLSVRVQEQRIAGVAGHEAAIVRIGEAAVTTADQSYARELGDDVGGVIA